MFSLIVQAKDDKGNVWPFWSESYTDMGEVDARRDVINTITDDGFRVVKILTVGDNDLTLRSGWISTREACQKMEKWGKLPVVK